MALYTSIKAGSWTDVVPATTPWNPVPPAGGPAAGDYVVIGHDILLDASASIGDALVHHAVDIGAGGILRWPVNANVTLTCVGTNTTKCAINIAAGGILQLGSSGAEIGSAFIAKILMTTAQRRILVTTSGEVRLYGYPNYRVERTTIAVDVAASTPATTVIQTNDAQDWVAGDEIWVGTGADKNTAPTEYEKITIVAPFIDTTHFNAVTTQGHVAGDILVNGMRNVIIDGNAAAGGSSIVATNSVINSNAYVLTMSVKASWAEFQFFGCTTYLNGIHITLSGTADDYTVPAGHFLVEHCLFDTPYAIGAYGLYFISQTLPVADSATCFTENHFYSNNSGTVARIDTYGSIFTLDKWTIIGKWIQGLYHAGMCPRLICSHWWVSGDSTFLINAINQEGSVQVSDSNFYSIGGGVNVWNPVPNEKSYWELNTISNCKFYHTNSSGSFIYFNSGAATGLRHAYISDCEFYDSAGPAVLSTLACGGNIVFERCSFDKANTSNFTTATGCAVQVSSVNNNWGTFKFVSCDFGMLTANKVRNIQLYATSAPLHNLPMRVIAENCRFKIPTGFAWTNAGSGDYPASLGYMVQDISRLWNTWEGRVSMPDTTTVEFINCESWDAAGSPVDQFQVSYPGVTRWGMVGGGGSEMMDEPIVKLDGTLAMKFVPFHCAIRSQFNKERPIKFSVASGKTVTVTVSLRKHLSQTAGRRPMVHMQGCGINTYSEMSDVNDTWEVQTISGVTTHGGDLNVWFSGISEWELASNGAGDPKDVYYSPATVGTYYFYADGFSIVIA